VQRLGRVVVLNSPMVFRIFWRMTAPFMAESTKQKVQLRCFLFFA
jgi:hypothetical protein